MLAVFFEEGDDVECLFNVCVIGEEGEDYSQFSPDNNSLKQEARDTKQTEQAEKKPAAETMRAAEPSGTMKISPRAKNLAQRTGADVSFAKPSGAGGRIIERDIQTVLEQGRLAAPDTGEYETARPIPGTGSDGRVITDDLISADNPEKENDIGYEEVRLSNIRKIIAKSMHGSLANTAQLTLNTTFDATEILSYRKKLKEGAQALNIPNITLNDIIVFVVSRVLLNHKDLNAHFTGDAIKRYHNAHIGIACDTERGLMVPTLFNANLLSLSEIAVKSKDLTDSCKAGTINPDLLAGGTFTITNLGTLGIESFTPVLNPPQTGILGVCGLTERTKNGAPYKAMGLSVTFDHQAVDGAPCARFLQEVVKTLESFSLMLAL